MNLRHECQHGSRVRVQKAAISTIYHDMGLDFGASNVLECFSASVSAISSAKMSLWESSVKIWVTHFQFHALVPEYADLMM